MSGAVLPRRSAEASGASGCVRSASEGCAVSPVSLASAGGAGGPVVVVALRVGAGRAGPAAGAAAGTAAGAAADGGVVAGSGGRAVAAFWLRVDTSARGAASCVMRVARYTVPSRTRRKATAAAAVHGHTVRPR